MVESQPSKLLVASSILVSRSNSAEQWLNEHWAAPAIVIAAAGFLFRLHLAGLYYLNPDEAMHYLFALQTTHGWVEWYRNAIAVAHPPLFIWLLHAALRLGNSEVAIRAIPAAAGALFPWFVLVWMRRFAGPVAAVCAQLVLTFSPSLIGLSTEVRAYTLAFLFVSISLVLLDRALERGSLSDMAWFHLFLYCAISTEYSIAWFVLAAGIYALASLGKNHAPLKLWGVWGMGQALAIALYAFFYETHLSQWSSNGLANDALNGWLRSTFLQTGDHAAIFALRGTFHQFKYLFAGSPAGFAGFAVFLPGLYWLWKRDWRRSMLIVLPFVAACAGAMFHLFPYGATRHTAVLATFAAAGFGEGCAVLLYNRMLPLLLAALALIPVWQTTALDMSLSIPPFRHEMSQMREAVEYLRTAIPRGAWVVTDTATSDMLAYYLHAPEDSPVVPDPYLVWESGGLKFLTSRQFHFGSNEQLQMALDELRRDFSWYGPIWVVAGGFTIDITNPAADAERFQQAVAIFETGEPAVP